MPVRDGALVVCLAVVLAGCGSAVRVVSVTFEDVGSNPRGRHTPMTLEKGERFEQVVSLLPTRLPPSSRLTGSDGCYEVTVSVRLSNEVVRVYEPCVHPKSIVRALRVTCRFYFGLGTVLAHQECSHLH